MISNLSGLGEGAKYNQVDNDDSRGGNPEGAGGAGLRHTAGDWQAIFTAAMTLVPCC